MRALPVLLIGLAGCLPPPTYQVQRSARVPRPAVPLHSGQPLDGPVELSVGATAGGHGKLIDRQAAIETPSTQARAELRFKIRRGEIAWLYERSLAGTFAQLDRTQAPVESGAPRAAGVALRYSWETGEPGLSVGTSVEVMDWGIPYVEYRTCVENCDGVTINERHTGTEHFLTGAFGITPSYRSGPWTVFGGAYTRRHPTIERKDTESNYYDDPDVSAGNWNFMVHAGVEYRTGLVSFLASIQQDLSADPVQYGPSIGVALAIHANRFKIPSGNPGPTPTTPGYTVPDPSW
jgi:hypothetical protein